jgi:hypothetical protein
MQSLAMILAKSLAKILSYSRTLTWASQDAAAPVRYQTFARQEQLIELKL